MRIRGVRAICVGGMFLAVWPGMILAAPSISDVSGGIVHGQQVQIVGSGFGQKSPAKPYLWAPMDGTHQPSALGVVTAWNQVENMAYAAGEGIAGGGAMKGTPMGVGPEPTWTASVVASGFEWQGYNDRMYLFRRTKRNWVLTSQHNWKIIRFWPAAVGGQPNWFLSNSGGIAISNPINSSAYLMTNFYATHGPANVWLAEELIVKSNSASGVSDATVQYHVNGVLQGQATTLRFKDTGSNPIVTAFPVHGVEAGDGNPGVVPAGGTYWADDVYLDRSWARVVIGNAPSLASSTHREVQIPFEWSADRIGVNVNIRSFPSGETPYLFVVDSAGVASPGYPIGDTVRPEPPRDVTAN